MNKALIIKEIITKAGIDKPAATVVTEAIMETIKKPITNGENVYLRGFGGFILKKRAEKVGQNISKGTSVKMPARYIPAFKPAKEFAEKVATKVQVK